jgi:hypothetical protein
MPPACWTLSSGHLRIPSTRSECSSRRHLLQAHAWRGCQWQAGRPCECGRNGVPVLLPQRRRGLLHGLDPRAAPHSACLPYVPPVPAATSTQSVLRAEQPLEPLQEERQACFQLGINHTTYTVAKN